MVSIIRIGLGTHVSRKIFCDAEVLLPNVCIEQCRDDNKWNHQRQRNRGLLQREKPNDCNFGDENTNKEVIDKVDPKFPPTVRLFRINENKLMPIAGEHVDETKSQDKRGDGGDDCVYKLNREVQDQLRENICVLKLDGVRERSDPEKRSVAFLFRESWADASSDRCKRNWYNPQQLEPHRQNGTDEYNLQRRRKDMLSCTSSFLKRQRGMSKMHVPG